MVGEPELLGVTLVGTSLPFVLIGPAGRHRRVVVKSAKDTLDLIGLDGLPEAYKNDQPIGLNFFALNFGRRERGQRNIVRSRETVTVGEGDGRTTFYSFAWRGLATARDRDTIRDHLSRISKDIEDALISRRPDDVEFALASIVLLCEQVNERRLRMRAASRFLGAITILLYSALALWALVMRK